MEKPPHPRCGGCSNHDDILINNMIRIKRHRRRPRHCRHLITIRLDITTPTTIISSGIRVCSSFFVNITGAIMVVIFMMW